MSAGKGSKRRPRDNRYCTAKQYGQRHARVFGKRKNGKGKVSATNQRRRSEGN